MPRKDLEHYWPDRVQEQDERNAKRTVKQTEKELHGIYKEQAEDLQNAILAVFAKMEVDRNTEHGIMINDLYRNRRYWELLNLMNDNLKKLGQEQLLITERHLVRAYEDTIANLDDELPHEIIEKAFLVTSMIDAKQVVHQTWCLDGEEFSDRIWDDKKKLLVKLKKSLSDFVIQGKSPWYISEQLRVQMQNSEYNAYRIVRTETAHLQIKAKTDRYQQLGFTHGKYLGTKCCPECKKENGKIYTLKELSTLLPKHPHCTCTFQLVRKEEA